jgi:hypothetical protein
MTIIGTGQSVNGWIVVDNRAEDIKLESYRYTQEVRFVNPDKELILYRNDDRGYIVRNGSKRYLHFHANNKFNLISQTVGKEKNNAVVHWAGLSPDDHLVKKRLLPDARINGTDVYVLELHIKLKQPNGKWTGTEKITVFVGKRDLLPRKREYVTLRNGQDATLSGLPADKYTEEILGFVVNTKLSDDLFSIEQIRK